MDTRERLSAPRGLAAPLAMLAIGMGTAESRAAPAAAAGAEQIMELAGRKAGLCVHLGCGRKESAAWSCRATARSRPWPCAPTGCCWRAGCRCEVGAIAGLCLGGIA
jgi:hypothetical protein